VRSLLSGIPQSGQTIGSPNAKITVTEYGDLQCPVCRDFALGTENQLISKDVRSGKVKLVYKSLLSATANSPDPSIFPAQQAAAYAAGKQSKAWDYILLFYHEQGQEGTLYVTPAFLSGLAKQIPGLNYATWQTESKNPALAAQVLAENQHANSRGFASTPTILVEGPKGQAQPIIGLTDYGTLESAINSVA
jgi:protein-disulfide isomerase